MPSHQLPFDLAKKLSEQLDVDFALQAAGLGVWAVEPATNKVVWDDRCRAFFGLARDNQLPYEQAIQYIHADDRDRVSQAVETALNSRLGGLYDQTYRTIGADDSRLRWVRFWGQAYFTPTGELYRFSGIAQEVTQQMLDQQQLIDQQAILQSIVQQTPTPTLVVQGDDYRIVQINQPMLTFMGRGEEVVGHPLLTIMPELAHQFAWQQVQQVYKHGANFDQAEVPVSHIRGGVRQDMYYDVSYRPLREGGRITGMIQAAIDVTDRVVARRQEERNQRQVLSLLEQSPVGLATYSADQELMVQWANPFFGAIFGHPFQAIVGKSLLETLPELEGQGFDEIINNVIETGTPFNAPEVAVDTSRDGQPTTIYVNLTYQPQKNAHGNVVTILMVATDVTQQVRSRKKVEESEVRFRSLLEEAPVATCLFVGREMIIEVANEAMIDVWGKGPAVIGMPLAKALPELQGQPFLPLLDELFTTGNTYTNKAGRADLVVGGQLSTYYFNYTFKPLRNSAGQVYAILETAVDVTQQVIAQQQLKQTEESLRSVIEVAEMGTWELNIKTGLVTYSDRLKRLFEFKEDTIEVGAVYNPIYEPDRLQVQEAMARAADPMTGGLLDEEYRIISQQNQREYVVRVQAKMYFDANGQPQKMIGAMRDITPQRQLQLALEQQVQQRTEELAATNEELAASNEEYVAINEEYAAINEELEEANSLLNQSNDNLQRFAYVASHDLQEPLRKIQSFGDLLKSRFADQLGEGVDYLTRMQVAASRMSTLIRDLLAYSRITSQRDTSDFVSLNEVVSKVLTDLELVIVETGASMYVGMLPDLPGDSSQLGQLFQNLVTNAIKFGRPGIAPAIQISARLVAADQLPLQVKPSRRVAVYQCIEVADNGIGFDEKYLDRIFQVFQRLHGRSEITGTGIGLAICEKVATSHGGSITATSQVGQGATFRVYLPA